MSGTDKQFVRSAEHAGVTADKHQGDDNVSAYISQYRLILHLIDSQIDNAARKRMYGVVISIDSEMKPYTFEIRAYLQHLGYKCEYIPETIASQDKLLISW